MIFEGEGESWPLPIQRHAGRKANGFSGTRSVLVLQKTWTKYFLWRFVSRTGIR